MIDLFSLQGFERLKKIKELTVDESDEICELHKECRSCPIAVIYNNRPYCADIAMAYRIESVMAKGGKFTVLEEIKQ